ncbi:hypothetical protein AUP68_01262 [Ilyonectria robusta]
MNGVKRVCTPSFRQTTEPSASNTTPTDRYVTQACLASSYSLGGYMGNGKLTRHVAVDPLPAPPLHSLLQARVPPPPMADVAPGPCSITHRSSILQGRRRRRSMPGSPRRTGWSGSGRAGPRSTPACSASGL